MPPSGRAAPPRRKHRQIRWNSRADVPRDGSRNTPARNGRSTLVIVASETRVRSSVSVLAPGSARLIAGPGASTSRSDSAASARLSRGWPSRKPAAPAAACGPCHGAASHLRSASVVASSPRRNGRSRSAVQVDLPAELGVGRQHHLESPVEEKAVAAVSADPAAHVVAGLADHRGQASPVQLDGGAQAGQAAADHDHIGGRRHEGLHPGSVSSGIGIGVAFLVSVSDADPGRSPGPANRPVCWPARASHGQTSPETAWPGVTTVPWYR